MLKFNHLFPLYSLRQTLCIVFGIVLTAFHTTAQTFSKQLEIKSNNQIASLKSKQKFPFESMTRVRLDKHVYVRMDSLTYDFLFIQEQFCSIDSTLHTTEYYFNANDSIPAFIFIDGLYKNPKELFDYTPLGLPPEANRFQLFANMLKVFSNTKPLQELVHKPEIYIPNRNKQNDENLKQMLEPYLNRLKNTYQIMTMIDKKADLIKISIQLPASNPIITPVFYDDMWGW